MYDTDKYKNYMSMIPQSWLGKAKALGLMGMGGIQIGAMGDTNSRPTPDWYPKNLQKESYRGNLVNAEMPDWYDNPKFYSPNFMSSRGPDPFKASSALNREFDGYGKPNPMYQYAYGGGGLPMDWVDGADERVTEAPYKFQSIGSNEKGQTMYEVEPNGGNPDSWRILWNHFGPSYAPAVEHFFGGDEERGWGRGGIYTRSGGGGIASPVGRHKQPKVDITSVSGGRGRR